MAEQFGITVTPDGAGSAQIAAAGTKVQVAKRPWDLFTGATQAVATVVTEDRSVEESLSGQNRAAERLAEIATMSAADRAAALETDRLEIETGESKYSDVHNKAYLAATTSTFFSAKAKAQAESNMRNASTAVDAMVIPEMLPTDYDKLGGFDWIAKNNNVDVAVVRDMYLTKQTDYFAGLIGTQSDQEGVDEIKSMVSESRKTLMGPKFYGSRSEDWKAAIKASETKLKNAEIAIQKKFKAEAEHRIATTIGDTSSSETSYTQPLTSELKKDFAKAYDNEITLNTKLNDYKKNFESAQEARNWHTAYKPGDVHPVLPEGKQLKAEWTKKVSESITSAFSEKRYGNFIDVAINEPTFIKDAGTELMTVFNNLDDPIALGAFVNNVEILSKHPNGATALRQTLGDDNYVSIMATQYMARTGHAKDLPTARQMISAGEKNIAVVNFSKQDQMKLSEYAIKLDTQGPAFLAMMNKFQAISPKMATDMLEKTAQNFLDQRTTIGDREVDTSMTPLIDGVSLDPERTTEKLFKALDKQAGGPVKSIVTIGNEVMGIDPLTGDLFLQNLDKVAEEANAEIKYEKTNADYKAQAAEGTIAGDVARAWDTHMQSMVGEVPSVFAQFGAGAAEAVGNIVSRFGGYLGKQWDSDVQGMKDGINEIFPDTFGPDQAETRYEAATEVLDEFDKIIMGTTTEDPRKYVSTNTLSSYVNSQLDYTLQANAAKVKVAETMQKYLFDKVALEHPETLLIDTDTMEKYNEKFGTPTSDATDNRGLP